MSDPVVNLINAIYDRKLSDLNLQIQNEISKQLGSPTFNIFFQEINVLYLKQVDLINIERNLHINNWGNHIYTQDFKQFLDIGKQMSEMKNSSRKSYDYIVDKAFAIDTPLSLYKFKYASK
jgi:hypothetical protein